MPVASVNGVDLNYEAAGNGNTVIFMHGFTGCTMSWASQLAALAPRYRAIALDCRGHGKSAAPKTEGQYSVQIFSKDVYDLVSALSIRKCCLVGHSMGGFTALQFALDHPDRVAALVLVDTSSGQWAKDPGYARLREKLGDIARNQGMEAAFEYDMANNPMRVEALRRHPELKEKTRQDMLRTSVDGFIYVSRAIGNWPPVTARLSEIKVPTLIFLGEEDVGFIEATRVMQSGIAGSQVVTVKGVGHSPHEEAPEVFNEALLKFLNGVKW